MEFGRRVGRRTASAISGVVQRRHRPDNQIVLYVGLLMLLGLVIMYAIGPQRANVLNNAYDTDFYTSTYFVAKQFVSLLLALAVFIIAANVPLEFYKKHSGMLLKIGFGLCVLLLITGNVLRLDAIAQCSLGACRWFELGPLGSFQPAEFLKFAVLVYMAGFIAIRMQQNRINDVQGTIAPMAVIGGLALFFTVVVQKDMGTGIALTSIILSMFMVAGVDRTLGMKILSLMLVAGILMIVVAPHRMERIVTFFQGDSTTSASDDGYHITQAKIAIGTGGLLGVGIGNSIQATGYLPEAINDSVFAILGETFGFVGVVVILLLFTSLLLRILRIADHLDDPWMKLVVAGVFGWLAAHVVLNIASMIGVFPLTGITLPLLSLGGTSMVFIAGALGLVYQISRYTIHGNLKQEKTRENPRSGRGLGRPRYTGRRSPS